MASQKKVRAKAVKGFHISERPGQRMTKLLKLPPAERARRLYALVEADNDRYAQVAKRRVAELSEAEID